jgi:hypothetical protein
MDQETPPGICTELKSSGLYWAPSHVASDDTPSGPGLPLLVGLELLVPLGSVTTYVWIYFGT